MEKETLKVAEAFLNAVKTMNMEQLVVLLLPDMQWSQPGNNAVSGRKQSAGDVFQMVGKMFALSGNTLALSEIKVLAVNGNQAACHLRWTASKASGETLDVDNIDVYTVANGQITEAVVYTADIDQENAFWR
ncbi:nuclear transport factor 2 family protein [Taibaiella koreensis]|uniref:nuclear transport factor 2 family protein n=1 Tax=Taibaiella koreensis TaxID=1268548 RepID=UPI000E59D0E8|nr:nuclear transport factor 2 family protein [Taibaiella koreensis]